MISDSPNPSLDRLLHHLAASSRSLADHTRRYCVTNDVVEARMKAEGRWDVEFEMAEREVSNG